MKSQIKTLLLAGVIVSSLAASTLKLDFASPWQKKHQVYHDLEDLYQSNIQQFWKTLANKEELDKMIASSKEKEEISNQNHQNYLEFLNNLEKNEAFRFDTDTCDMWFKSINMGEEVMKTYCSIESLQKGKEKQTFRLIKAEHEMEFHAKDKVKYSDLGTREIIIAYVDVLDPKFADVISVLVGEFNFILRYRFKDGRSLMKETERLSGFAVEFNLSPNQLVRKEDTFLTERVIQQPDFFSVYQYCLVEHLREASSLGELTNSLATYPDLGVQYRADQLFKGEKMLAETIRNSILRQQFFIANYKVIELTPTLDVLSLKQQLKEVEFNSAIIEELVENPDQLYSNILTFHNRIEALPFQPPENGATITVTTPAKDDRFESKPTEAKHLLTEEYRKNLEIKSNINQLYLYLDVNYHSHQAKVVKALHSLNMLGAAIQLHVAFTDSKEQKNELLIKQLYHQISLDKAKSPMKVFQTLKSFFNDNKTISEYEESAMKKTESFANKGLTICEDINVCVFPFIIVNEVVIDQQELFAVLDQSETFEPVEQYLREIIMIKGQEAASYITVENSFISAHFDFKYQETQSTYEVSAVNVKKFLQQKEPLPTVHIKIASEKMKASDVQVVLFDSESQKTQSIKSWLAHYQKVKGVELAIVLVKNPKQVNIKGHLNLENDYTIFINGEYQKYVKNFRHLRQLLDDSALSTKRMLKGVNLKEGVHSCQVASEVNVMGAIIKGEILPKYIDTLKLSQEHSNSNYEFSNKLQDKPLINFQAKLHILTRESIQFLSLLNQGEFNYHIDLYMYAIHSLGLRFARTTYQYYHQVWHSKNKDETLIPVSEVYQYLQLSIQPSRRHHFIIDSISHYDSHLTLERNEEQGVFGKFSTLDFDTALLASQKQQVSVGFRLKHQQIYANLFFVMSRFCIWKRDYKAETMTKFDGALFAGRLRNQILIAHESINMYDHFMAIAPYPGRYYYHREEDARMHIVDFDYSYDPKPINIMLDNVGTTALDEQEKYIFIKLKTKVGSEIDYAGTTNVYLPCTGSVDESLVLKNINQIMLNKKYSEKIIFHLMEGHFMSPDFKENLKKLQIYHKQLVFNFLNLAYPTSHFYIDQEIKRNLAFYHSLFLDVLFPLPVDYVIFMEASVHIKPGVSIVELQNVDISGNILAMVPNQHFFDDTRYIEYWVNALQKQGKPYYHGGIGKIDLRTFRKYEVSPYMRNRFQQLSDHPTQANLQSTSQDLINDCQVVLKIQTLPDSWLFISDYFEKDQNVKKANAFQFQLSKEPGDYGSPIKPTRLIKSFNKDFLALKTYLADPKKGMKKSGDKSADDDEEEEEEEVPRVKSKAKTVKARDDDDELFTSKKTTQKGSTTDSKQSRRAFLDDFEDEQLKEDVMKLPRDQRIAKLGQQILMFGEQVDVIGRFMNSEMRQLKHVMHSLQKPNKEDEDAPYADTSDASYSDIKGNTPTCEGNAGGVSMNELKQLLADFKKDILAEIGGEATTSNKPKPTTHKKSHVDDQEDDEVPKSTKPTTKTATKKIVNDDEDDEDLKPKVTKANKTPQKKTQMVDDDEDEMPKTVSKTKPKATQKKPTFDDDDDDDILPTSSYKGKSKASTSTSKPASTKKKIIDDEDDDEDLIPKTKAKPQAKSNPTKATKSKKIIDDEDDFGFED